MIYTGSPNYWKASLEFQRSLGSKVRPRLKKKIRNKKKKKDLVKFSEVPQSRMIIKGLRPGKT